MKTTTNADGIEANGVELLAVFKDEENGMISYAFANIANPGNGFGAGLKDVDAGEVVGVFIKLPSADAAIAKAKALLGKVL